MVDAARNLGTVWTSGDPTEDLAAGAAAWHHVRARSEGGVRPVARSQSVPAELAAPSAPVAIAEEPVADETAKPLRPPWIERRGNSAFEE
jgi:hypothetical protein